MIRREKQKVVLGSIFKKEYFFKLVLFVNFVKGIDKLSKLYFFGKEDGNEQLINSRFKEGYVQNGFFVQ